MWPLRPGVRRGTVRRLSTAALAFRPTPYLRVSGGRPVLLVQGLQVADYLVHLLLG